MFLKPQIGELDKDQLAALYREVQSFVQAGGVVTLSEWRAMDPVERAVLIEVRKGGPVRELGTLEGLADAIESRLAPRESAGAKSS